MWNEPRRIYSNCLPIAKIGFALLAGLIAATLSFPSFFALSEDTPLWDIRQVEGYLLAAPLPQGLTTPSRRTWLPPDMAVVLEDGVALPTPATGRGEIALAGWGRYRFAGREVFFSTRDGALPSGRSYTVRTPLFQLPEWLLVPFWAIVFTAATGALSPWLTARPGVAGGLLGLCLASAMGFFPGALSEGFFHGLAIPLVWSCSVALLAAQRGFAGALLIAVVMAIPVWAAHCYYAVSGWSHSWFLLGGLIPLSDAQMHFRQAVEILQTGQATTGFNGRFLYPMFLASLMALTGDHAQLVNLASMLLAMGCLAVTAKAVVPIAGLAGTALMVLLTWGFFRVNGAWLSMTENLGLPLGLLATSFFVIGSRAGRFAPCAAGLFLFATGMATRPGALFILPALAGWCVLRFGGGIMQPKRWLAVGFASGVVVLAGMGANNLATATVYKGESPAYQNFAFSLNGLLTGSDWSKSHNNGLGNPQEVMEENKRLLRENPLMVVKGAMRTLEYLWPRGFFFRFERELRLVGIASLAALAGLIALAFEKSQSTQRGWMLAACLGILLSLPFAPPWDAGSRPYAVTMPIVFLLCGIGLRSIIQISARLTRTVASSEPDSPSIRSSSLAIGTAAALLLIPTFAPLSFGGTPVGNTARELRPGGLLSVHIGDPIESGTISRSNFLQRISPLAVNRPELRDRFLEEPGDFTLAIDWNGPQFRVVSEINSTGQSQEFGSLEWDLPQK